MVIVGLVLLLFTDLGVVGLAAFVDLGIWLWLFVLLLWLLAGCCVCLVACLCFSGCLVVCVVLMFVCCVCVVLMFCVLMVVLLFLYLSEVARCLLDLLFTCFSGCLLG